MVFLNPLFIITSGAESDMAQNISPSPYLDCIEEQELADHLINVAKIGFGKARKEDKKIAEDVAKEINYYEQLEFLMDGGKSKICPFIVQIPLLTSE